MTNWLNNINLYDKVDQYLNYDQITAIFIFIMFTIIIIEIIYIIKFNFLINQMIKRIKNKKNDESIFLRSILDEYKKRNQMVIDSENISSFIEGYFYANRNGLRRGIKILEQSDAYFILFGFLGAFIILLLEIVRLNIYSISSLQYIISLLMGLIPTLRLALYSIIIGIVCSIVIKLINRIWNTNEKVERLFCILRNFLEQETEGQAIREQQETTQAINNLISTLENTIIRLEDIMEDTMAESFAEMEDTVKKIYNEINEKNSGEGKDSKGSDDSINPYLQIAATKKSMLSNKETANKVLEDKETEKELNSKIIDKKEKIINNKEDQALNDQDS